MMGECETVEDTGKAEVSQEDGPLDEPKRGKKRGHVAVDLNDDVEDRRFPRKRHASNSEYRIPRKRHTSDSEYRIPKRA